ncbi:hypothetical protein KY363_07305 [Candidatus Woesearchaeota archaeon]|nr:hypothetical protein [Candidatus Woesearchaeota archaeon]
MSEERTTITGSEEQIYTVENVLRTVYEEQSLEATSEKTGKKFTITLPAELYKAFHNDDK